MRNSLHTILLATAVAAGAGAAHAAARPEAGLPPVSIPESTEPLLLAQSRDIDVFFDGRGNRIILDARTGEVLAVEAPRRLNRRALREIMREQRLRQRQDRYYLNDPEDMARYRRDRARERGVQDDEVYTEAEPEIAEPDEFPEAPQEVRPRRRQAETRSAERRQAERRAAERRAAEEDEVAEERPIVRRPLPKAGEVAGDVPVPQPAERGNLSAAAREAEAIERETQADTVEEAALEPPAEDDAAGEAPALAAPAKSAAAESAPPAAGAAPAGQDVAAAEPGSEPAFVEPPGSEARTQVAELQVLLDRAGASPGVIDGRFGSNVDKALAAYGLITGKKLRSTDAAGIKAALAETGGDAFVDYTITNEDVAGPFVASVPEDYAQKAKLERLSYTSVTEALAERFHMDEGFLKAINPNADFRKPGTVIRVASTGQPVATKVARIVADKTKKQVRAFDAEDNLVAAYPATIGSSDNPSPSGTHAVERIALNPEYTYNPKVNFKQGDNEEVLTIPPGPNGPVGSVWIALSKPTYGVHGTPEPSKIGKTESHGCVRLTNWDAQELAKLVSEGVTVEFAE